MAFVFLCSTSKPVKNTAHKSLRLALSVNLLYFNTHHPGKYLTFPKHIHTNLECLSFPYEVYFPRL